MPQAGYTKRRAKWTHQAMLKAAREWHALHGRSPAASDWNPSTCRRSARISVERAGRWMGRVARFEAGEWPWHGSVLKEFDTWNDFLAEAELPLNHIAPERTDPTPVGEEALQDLVATALTETFGPAKKAALLAVAESALRYAESIPDG